MRRLLLSPHADDAVWSCGGVIGRWAGHGQELTVLTVFDGDGPHACPSTAGSPAERRREDAEALAHWPVIALSLGLPEALLRYDERGCPRYMGHLALRRGPHPLDAGLVELVAGRVRPLLHACDELLVPLAERTHVDHRIVRLAGESAVRSIAPESCEVRYYAEFPYNAPPPAGPRERWESAEFGPWLRASLVYRSQVDKMFGGAPAFARALRRHACSGHGCRWRSWSAQPRLTRRDEGVAGGDAQPPRVAVGTVELTHKSALKVSAGSRTGEEEPV
ncbi:PIG-L family deacetylase [Streptomyces canus]|uniref:PIG-L deacetylase family protein n=1 Tax=Streptomyces canus TaxID=58343 RepID=UPI0030E247FA